MRRLTIILPLTLFILQFGSPAQMVWTTPASMPATQTLPGLTCNSLDVIFLVDQSNSMWTTTDPTNQRAYAPQVMIDLLADLVEQQCPDAEFRIEVVFFGTKAEVVLPLSTVQPTANGGNLEVLKQLLVSTDRGWTNPLEAFQRALETRGTPPRIIERKRLIILLTDGQPCLEEADCRSLVSQMESDPYMREMKAWIDLNLPFDAGLRAQEACLTPLWAQYGERALIPPTEFNRCLTAYPLADPATTYQNSTYLWVVLLNAQELPQKLSNQYRVMAQDRAGDIVQLSREPQAIPATFRRILERLIGFTSTSITCGEFFPVNPYLRKAILAFYKSEPDLPVILSYTDLQGVQHTISAGVSGETGGFDVEEYQPSGENVSPNERYVFHNPTPGIWQLRAENCRDLVAFYEPITFVSNSYADNLPEIPQVSEIPYYNPENPVFLKYQIRATDGDLVTMAEHPRFILQVQALVTDPDGNQRTYLLDWVPNEQFFLAKEPLRSMLSGQYFYTVTVSTYLNISGPPILSQDYTQVFDTLGELFRKDGLSFQVFPVTPFMVQVIQPLPGINAPSTFEAGANERIPVQVRLIDQQGEPLAASQIFTDPEVALWVTLRTTEAQSQSVLLQSDPMGPDILSALLDSPEVTSTLRLTVSLASQPAPSYQLVGKLPTIEFTWIKHPPQPTPVVILLSNPAPAPVYITQTPLPSWLYWLVLLYSLIVLILLYRLHFAAKPIVGKLAFIDEIELRSFPVYKGRTHYSRRELDRYPHLGLLDLRIQHLDNQTGVRIQYITRQGRFKSPIFILAPDIETILSSTQRVICVKYRPQAESSKV